MKKLVNGVYIDLTAEELEDEKKQSAIRNAREKYSPMSAEEVTRLLIAQQINTLAVDDVTALRMKDFYPKWEVGATYGAVYGGGHKVQYGGKLWRLLQPHTAHEGWEPENAQSLWERINETHDGTIDDAIPYDGNMALENGRYYAQDNVLYLCNRDTGNPVYHALAELVGLYVEEV